MFFPQILFNHFRKKSDEILIQYGGYYFNSDENMFISSKMILQSQRYSNHERKRSEEKLKSLLITASEMPHKQDMSDHPGYINKLFTVRSDLSVSLCKHSRNSQITKIGLKCHYSFVQLDIWRRLLPFKIEVLNNFPVIKIVHDFISNQGIIPNLILQILTFKIIFRD